MPVLGSIPLLGQAFRFKSVTRARTNLAFIITPIAFQAESPMMVNEYDRASIIGPERSLTDPDLIGPVNMNATDFHNVMSTGQSQGSEKNPVIKHKRSKPKQEPMENSLPALPAAKPED